MYSVTVGRLDDRLVAQKTADAESATGLRAEARLLARLDHPGLVQLVDLVEADGAIVMRTVFAGGDTWASRPPTDPPARAAGVAAVAATIADLHERGVAHGALRADHIIHGADGRPVLCGLSHNHEATPASRHGDLSGLADIIHDDSLERGATSGALSALATDVRDGRCDASEVVRRANRLASQTSGARRPHRLPRRHALVVAAGLAVITVATIAVAGASQRSSPEARPDPIEPATERSSESRVSDSPSPNGRDDTLAADAEDPAAPAEPGAVVSRNGRRYAIGRQGDLVVIGDWDCDGTSTPAVLRPTTGEIAVFQAWPTAGASLSTPVARVVTDARSLSIESADSCDRLRVTTGAGSALVDLGTRP